MSTPPKKRNRCSFLDFVVFTLTLLSADALMKYEHMPYWLVLVVVAIATLTIYWFVPTLFRRLRKPR